MKISKETLEILKNYSQINGNILVRAGNTLSAISEMEHMFSQAVVQEDFPQEFAIYDLANLLGLLTLSADSEVEFTENYLTISKDGGQFKYHYTDPSMVKTPPKKGLKVNSCFEFQLSSSDIAMLTKAAGLTKATHISIIADGEVAKLVVGKLGDEVANSYQKVLGETELSFACHLQIDNFKLVSGSYVVNIDSNGFVHFKGTDHSIQYWIAIDPSSTF